MDADNDSSTTLKTVKIVGFEPEYRGVIVEYEGRKGRVPVYEISWSRTKNPRDVFEVGELVDVVITDCMAGGFIASVRKVHPEKDPFLREEIKVGRELSATVHEVNEKFAYIDLGEGLLAILLGTNHEVEGLPGNRINDLSAGDAVQVRIVDVNRERRTVRVDRSQE